MTPLLWFAGLSVFAILVVLACALTLGSDADDIADATLEKLKEKHGHREH